MSPLREFDASQERVVVGESAAVARAENRRQGKRRKGEHWKESRVACVMSMSGPTHEVDPMPDLPAFLAGGTDLERKLSEIGHVMALPDSAAAQLDNSVETASGKSPRRSRKKPLPADQRPLPGPELVHRYCLASAACWRDFGETVAAEAWSQGFAGVQRKVCICDGNDAIRSVCETHFSDYVHALDLMQALGYAMNAARAVGGSRAEIASRYRQWAEQIWLGQVSVVLAGLDDHQRVVGDAPEGASTDDPREAIRKTRVYYGNQQSRMDYPRYRRFGFPLTSSLMEPAPTQQPPELQTAICTRNPRLCHFTGPGSCRS